MSNPVSATPRRGFLGSIAAGAAALVVGRVAKADAEVSALLAAPPVSDAWIAKIKGKYRQVFDCVEPNDGFGAAFGMTFIATTKEALKATDADITAVTVFRHFAMPLLVNDSIWAKYHVGEALKVNDPKTNAPALRNIFRDNVPLNPGLTYEQIMTSKPALYVACNMALTVVSGMLAPKAKVTPEAAKAEWTANILPGVYLAPSGVYAVNRAQQSGCSYCHGG